MAQMHPEDIEGLETSTPGERIVFRFLREAARPYSEFIGWYEPAIGEQGREPDFVLFGNHHGLLILEVKDWQIDQSKEDDSLNRLLKKVRLLCCPHPLSLRSTTMYDSFLKISGVSYQGLFEQPVKIGFSLILLISRSGLAGRKKTGPTRTCRPGGMFMI
jgi:hypothetical protein